MARFGINPARGKVSSYSPAQVTVALLTYIPHLDGYFQHRFEILQLTIASLIANTHLPYDLLVFDNASTNKIVDFLKGLYDQGTIRYLLLSSENVGKIGAFELIFNAAPGQYIAYSDDDIFFYPGWLAAHMKIFEAFPKVGMVSGSPVRDASERASQSLNQLINASDQQVSVSYQRRIPDDWEVDWALSVGRNPQEHLEKTASQQDIILESDGVEAFGSASHFQFVAPKKIIIEALPKHWSGKLMGEMNELDDSVDQLGYLRLSTVQRYTRHLGNTVSPDLFADAKKMKIETLGEVPNASHKKHWLLSIPGSGRLLRRLYNYLFNILHQID
jgi:glycosyltransferase involved in cell wall biosynthesis